MCVFNLAWLTYFRWLFASNAALTVREQRGEPRSGEPDERSEEAPAIFWVLKSVPLFPSGPLLELVGLPEFAAVSYF